MSLSIGELKQFATTLAESPERWRHLVRHADDARVYGQIWDDEDVNAWLICWSEDQDTGFHDHDESAAGIAVVSGTVREDRLTLSGEPLSREIGSGTTFTLPPVAIHRVLHAGTGPAVTIHCYSPPLRRTGAYRVGEDGTLERESQSFEVELAGELAPA
jgi:mannose-6-phosphate isomerase-like protein (cupin superfamily)